MINQFSIQLNLMVCNTPSENTVQHLQFRLQKLRSRALKRRDLGRIQRAGFRLDVHIFWILCGSPFLYWAEQSAAKLTLLWTHSTLHWFDSLPKVLLTQRHSSAPHLCESVLWLKVIFTVFGIVLQGFCVSRKFQLLNIHCLTMILEDAHSNMS